MIVAKGSLAPGAFADNATFAGLDVPGPWIVETDNDGLMMLAVQRGGSVTFAAGKHEWNAGPAFLFNLGEAPIGFTIRLKRRSVLPEGMPMPAE